ncbi:MAG: hypothetical protein IK149_01590 [Oscillospiraceae bacterium]|nr:hypothetical protein [Oscillospiraceae bacterium]
MKPQVGRSILFGILGAIVYLIFFFIVDFLLLLLTDVLSAIPLLRVLLNWFYSVRGDSPQIFAAIISVLVLVVSFAWLFKKIHDNDATKKLTYIIFGTLVILTSVLFVLAAIDGEGSVIVSAIYGLGGLYYFIAGIKGHGG